MFLYAQPRYRRSNEAMKAAFFGVFIVLFLAGSLIAGLFSGPIVLGTEMNTNGLVEYLCLGKGCENLHGMDW